MMYHILFAEPLADAKARLIRFSDFIVNEVDLGGNVVHLSDLEAPPQVSFNQDVFVLRLSVCVSLQRLFDDQSEILLIIVHVSTMYITDDYERRASI